MLEEVELRIRRLRAQAVAIEPILPSSHMLPAAIQAHLVHLDRVLRQDIDEARMGATAACGRSYATADASGLVAELRGNVEGLLSLTGDQALVRRAGSGGRI